VSKTTLCVTRSQGFMHFLVRDENVLTAGSWYPPNFYDTRCRYTLNMHIATTPDFHRGENTRATTRSKRYAVIAAHKHEEPQNKPLSFCFRGAEGLAIRSKSRCKSRSQSSLITRATYTLVLQFTDRIVLEAATEDRSRRPISESSQVK
jgi:hypothetical protein